MARKGKVGLLRVQYKREQRERYSSETKPFLKRAFVTLLLLPAGSSKLIGDESPGSYLD